MITNKGGRIQKKKFLGRVILEDMFKIKAGNWWWEKFKDVKWKREKNWGYAISDVTKE